MENWYREMELLMITIYETMWKSLWDLWTGFARRAWKISEAGGSKCHIKKNVSNVE